MRDHVILTLALAAGGESCNNVEAVSIFCIMKYVFAS